MSWRSSNDSQPNGRSHIVLITDGQIANEEAVLKEVSGHPSPIHCFGIDHAVNEAFLRKLGGQQRGTSAFLTPDDDLVRPVAILGSRLGRPVFTHLTLDGAWELADTELPDIHAGQVVFASIRAKDNASDINVAGKDADGRPLTVSLETQAVETDLPKLIWMKHRIDSLLQDGKDMEAIALAKKANLVCRGTVFIAWDDAEKVAIAQNEVYQPSFDLPSGLLYSRRRVSSSDSTMNFFESRVTEYQKAPVLAPCSDEELVSDIFDLKETKRLTEQVSATIDSAFCTSDAKEARQHNAGLGETYRRKAGRRGALRAAARMRTRPGRRKSAQGALGLFPCAARSLESKGELHVRGRDRQDRGRGSVTLSRS